MTCLLGLALPAPPRDPVVPRVRPLVALHITIKIFITIIVMWGHHILRLGWWQTGHREHIHVCIQAYVSIL